MYPLPFAYLLIPLTFLPFSTAAVFFFHLNLAISAPVTFYPYTGMSGTPSDVLSGAHYSRVVKPGNSGRVWSGIPPTRCARALTSIIFFTSRSPLTRRNLGQVTFFVLLPLALIPWLTRNHQEGWAGVMIAIATVLKDLTALLMGYLLLRRRWRALIVAVVVTVAVLAGLSGAGQLK